MNRIHHLSHNDLDGYSCQYVTKEILSQVVSIEYYNADYGKVEETIEVILDKIKENELLLISDLNLTLDYATYLDNKSKEKNFRLLLIDHHITGKEANEAFDWYHLDSSKCGAQGVLDYYTIDEYGNRDRNIEELINIIDLVNTYDMWIKDDDIKFNRSTYLSNVIFDNIIEHSDIKRMYNFYMIEAIGKELLHHSTKYVEEKYPFYINDFIDRMVDIFDFYIEELKSDEIPASVKLVYLSLPYLDDFKVLEIQTKYGLVKVYTDISSKTSQYCFGALNEKSENKNNIYVNYNKDKGLISVRSSNHNAVHIAKSLNGGGHPDAAGGYINPNDGIKEIKKILENLKD